MQVAVVNDLRAKAKADRAKQHQLQQLQQQQKQIDGASDPLTSIPPSQQAILTELRSKSKSEKAKQQQLQQQQIDAGLDPLTIRSIQEQLRLDHIETLEVLEQKVLEIAALKQELLALKAKVTPNSTSTSSSANTNAVNEAANDDVPVAIAIDETLLLNRVSQQEKELKDMKNKLASVQLELTDQKENYRNQLQREAAKRKQVESDAAKMELSYKNNIATLSDKLTTFATMRDDYEQLVAYVEQLKDAGERQLQSRVQSIHDNADQLKEARAEIKSLKRQLEEVSGLLLDRSNAAIQLVEEKNKQQVESDYVIAQLRLQLADAQQDAAAVQVKYESSMEAQSTLQAELARIRSELNSKRLESPSGNSEKYDSNFNTDSCPACRRPWKLPIEDDQTIPLQETSVDAEPRSTSVDMLSDGGRTFEEFVRLKKENRSLKLQLSELCKSASAISASIAVPDGTGSGIPIRRSSGTSLTPNSSSSTSAPSLVMPLATSSKKVSKKTR